MQAIKQLKIYKYKQPILVYYCNHYWSQSSVKNESVDVPANVLKHEVNLVRSRQEMKSHFKRQLLKHTENKCYNFIREMYSLPFQNILKTLTSTNWNCDFFRHEHSWHLSWVDMNASIFARYWTQSDKSLSLNEMISVIILQGKVQFFRSWSTCVTEVPYWQQGVGLKK